MISFTCIKSSSGFLGTSGKNSHLALSTVPGASPGGGGSFPKPSVPQCGTWKFQSPRSPLQPLCLVTCRQTTLPCYTAWDSPSLAQGWDRGSAEGTADGMMDVTNACRVTTPFTELWACFFRSPDLGRAVFTDHLFQRQDIEGKERNTGLRFGRFQVSPQ